MTRDFETAPLSGEDLLFILTIATGHLRSQRGAIDAINVYPVPDGDTGSNMDATLGAAIEAGLALPAPRDAEQLLAAVAKGALYGARGNSGVILSQALRGLADGAKGGATLDAAGLAAGLQAAADMAYAAVSKPVEGTMLTVVRAAGSAAVRHAATLPRGGRGSAVGSTLVAALRAAETAEALTPTQLPALAEAGVTDSGGEGVCVILRGILGGLTGEVVASSTATAGPMAELSTHRHEEFGFCTEFLLEASDAPLDTAAVRAFAAADGRRSVVVVGDEAALRVHVHTGDPESFLAAAAIYGQVTRTKVEDMERQHGRFRATGSGASARLAVLAMSPGKGFDAIFASLGAAVAPLHQLKPAAGDIATAADHLGAAEVLVLPNHSNVLMAARQAAGLTHCSLIVVPSQSLPQGIAAAVAFDVTRTAAFNAAAMAECMAAITTIEIATAAADRTADGVVVRAGDAIALINGRLIGRGHSLLEVMVGALNRIADDGEGLVTIYAGEDITDDALDSTRKHIANSFRGATVDAYRGEQPVYSYIVSLER